MPATHEMHKRYGQYIYGKYGFVDAFNPSFDYDVPLKRGRRVRGVGWVATDYLGIDQGAIISMIENHRSELMWTRDEAQSAICAAASRWRASKAAGSTCRWRIELSPQALIHQPALSASCGTRPATDSSVSTKLVCHAVMEFFRSTSSIAW